MPNETASALQAEVLLLALKAAPGSTLRLWLCQAAAMVFGDGGNVSMGVERQEVHEALQRLNLALRSCGVPRSFRNMRGALENAVDLFDDEADLYLIDDPREAK